MLASGRRGCARAERAEGRDRCLCPQRGGHGGRGGGRHGARHRHRHRRGPRRHHQHLGAAAARAAQRPRLDPRGSGNALRGRPWHLGRAGEPGRAAGPGGGLSGVWGRGYSASRPGFWRSCAAAESPAGLAGPARGERPLPALRSSPEVLGLCPGAGGCPGASPVLAGLREHPGAAQAFAQPFCASLVCVAFPAKKGSSAWDCNNAASKFKRISWTKAASWY